MADSWEDKAEEAPKPKTSSSLNVSAKPFTFNPSAASWSAPPPLPSAPIKTNFIPPPPPLSVPPATSSFTHPSPSVIQSPPKPKSSPVVVASNTSQSTLVGSPVISSSSIICSTDNLEESSFSSSLPSSIPLPLSPTSLNVPFDEEEEEEEVEEVDEDPREHLSVVFIGHVDAGKSTLSGNILYLMGVVDKRTIERFEKEAKQRNRDSWFLAFIMDTGEEERAKGKTVEVGRAYFETENKRITILDAPGHKNYVPNMIQGASQADVAVLVISARKGEFETGFERGGQTREHAILAKTLGVDKLIVVINKMDEAEWSEERFAECENKLKPFLKSCGYAVKRDVTFIPIAALTGQNIKDPVDKILAPWWKGETLLTFLDKLEISGRDPLKPIRVPILDRYQDRGTVALGKVESGILKKGAALTIMPTSSPVCIQQVYINDIAVRTAKPGENVKIKLSCGIEDLHRGFVLCPIGKECPQVKSFVAQIALIDLLDHRPIFTAGYTAVVHVHTATVECVVTALLREVNQKTGKSIKKKLTFARQGAVVICRLELEQTIPLETFEDMPRLGRLTLRDEGKTIAIGKILKLDHYAS